jgi:hypothetical protein
MMMALRPEPQSTSFAGVMNRSRREAFSSVEVISRLRRTWASTAGDAATVLNWRR